MNTTVLYLATSDGPIIVRHDGPHWRAERPLGLHATADDDKVHASIASDPLKPERVFYALPEHGVWRTDDRGSTWRKVFAGLPHDRVTALAVGATGNVYVGTEPSALFTSQDGGETWTRCGGMEKLPSAKQWSFPPRPESHHTQWIINGVVYQPDPRTPDKLLVAVEAGALLMTPDDGQTWRDAVPGSPSDTHQLALHPDRPQHIWSAAGDGIFESCDGGDTWTRVESGLRFRYGWSLAIDPGNPQIVILSAAPDAGQAHGLGRAESALFRREGEADWQQLQTGLPAPEGSLAAVVASHNAEPGIFYAAINGVVYRSDDAGKTWHSLRIDWPAQFATPHIHAMTVASG
ncbi:MAG: hypothetical protein ABI883_09380 [Chthoniobacterales bacterium]